MKKKFLLLLAGCLWVSLCAMTGTYAADYTITKQEWAEYMKNSDFAAADAQLTQAYKALMNSLPDNGKKELRDEQRKWGVSREKGAFSAAVKGSPEYLRFFIDEGNKRIELLATRLESKGAPDDRKGENFISRTVAKINPEMPEFAFELKSFEMKGSGGIYTNAILVMDAKTGKVLQNINPREFHNDVFAGTRETTNFIVEDLNFDGFADIRIRAGTPAGPNIPYLCWVWNKSEKQYVFSQALSDIPSLEVDGKNHWITAFYRESAAVHGESFYRWEAGELILFREVRDDFGEEKTTVREFLDGKMIVVEERPLKMK